METTLSVQDIKDLFARSAAESLDIREMMRINAAESNERLKKFEESVARNAKLAELNEVKYAQDRAEAKKAYEKLIADLAKEEAESKKAYEKLIADLAKEGAESKKAHEKLIADIAKRDEERKALLEKELNDLKRELALNDEARKREAEKMSRELNKKLAEFGDSMGMYAETAVQEALIKLFGDWGIPVKYVFPHAKQKDDNGQPHYEIDLLLYNSGYVIVVEVKYRARPDDIEQHLKRMERIKGNPMSIFKGKILLSCIASLVNNENLEQSAMAAGLFYIKPSGDTVALANKKDVFKPREWVVD